MPPIAWKLWEAGSKPNSVSLARRATVINLDDRLPDRSCSLPGNQTGRINPSSPIWPCSGRGLPTGPLRDSAVVSYTTISPLPALRRAVSFLWHFPSDRSAPALPGALILWSSDFPHSNSKIKARLFLLLPQAFVNLSSNNSLHTTTDHSRTPLHATIIRGFFRYRHRMGM